MTEINGWKVFEHPEFATQRAKLIAIVEAARANDPDGYRTTDDAKLLAAILKLTTEIIPSDPTHKSFRQGSTLGKERKHWFRAKFGAGRYRLFFQFNTKAKIIIYAWVNDDQTLRTYGAKTDAYSVFASMLNAGNPPDSWADLLKAVQPKPVAPPATKARTRTKR